MKLIIFFCFLVYTVVAKHEIYDGHALYEINVNNADQIEFLNEVENQLLLDVWSHAMPGRAGEVLVPKDRRMMFEDGLKAAGIEFKVEVENIKEMLELEDQLLAKAAAKSRSNSSRLSFDTIHTYDAVNAYIDELGRAYPDRVSVVLGGKSFEGRDIKYLKISSSNFQDTSKPIIMMQSLLHCREWVSLPATLYAIQKLVIDVTESDLIDNIDWIILPVANPDGYVWSHENARFWRKNRATGYMIGNLCLGVDLNRNFDIHWSTASSASVCSDTFHGSSAFSEPETSVIRDILAQYSNRMGLYLDIHSFGSMILYGYGNGVLPSNALVLNMIAVRMATAIDRVKWSSNPNYILGNIAMVLYDASGGASDYAMSVGVPLSYTYELPAYRNLATMNGFLVDPDFIEQAGFETWEGIKEAARYVVSTFNRK